MHAVDVGQEVPSRLVPHRSRSGFNYSQGDVTSEDFVARWCDEPLDVVFHLAAVVGVDRYCSDPLWTIDVNLQGTRNVGRVVEGRGIRLLYTSTSEVYGKNPQVPWSEDSERVLGPTWVDRWAYGSSKAVGEQILLALGRNQRVPVTIVRYFNVYGQNQSPNLVVPSMIQRIHQGQPPLIIGSGEETRCFTFISDAVEGTIRAATSDHGIGQVFNIGSDAETRILDLANLILRVAGRTDLTPSFVSGSEVYGSYENIQRRVPDVTKARRLLDWQATTPLEYGVQATFDDFVQQQTRTVCE